MEKENFFELPPLEYAYTSLEPHISEAQLRLHHDLHHRSYIEKANFILKTLDESRQAGTSLDMKSELKSLSFNVGGHILHSLFWKNLAPEGKGGEPDRKTMELIKEEFGNFERFKKEFSDCASSVEGSGWAVLAISPESQRPLIAQIEKHNVNLYPDYKIIMVLDVWEHAYYLDYENKRDEYINGFWNLVNWNEIKKRI